MTKRYNSDDIKVLSDRDHVRLRTQIYLGNMNRVEYSVPSFIDSNFQTLKVEFVPAAFKAIGEIIDNANDELTQLKQRNKQIDIQGDSTKGFIAINDNGRGIPIDKHSSGKYTPEVALASLRAGRNFGETEAGVVGQNGVGSACTNYCSTEFNVTIQRDGKKYTQTFKDGASKIGKPSIVSGPKKTGTTVSFVLDPQVFSNGVDIPEEMLHNRAIELAFSSPGLTVQFKDYKYKFNNGLEDIVKKISNNYHVFETENMQFFVIFDKHVGIDEQMFTWVNSSLLFDGGICNTQFTNAFYDRVCQHLSNQAKKLKCEVTKNDVRQDLLILGCLKIEKPEYDAQSKTRLTGPNLRKPIVDLVDEKWKSFARAKKEWLEAVLERAAVRHKSAANKQAIKQLSKNTKKKIPGLIDATSKYRHHCILTVTEGLSASSMISEVRNPETIAVYPLTGKINNVYGCSPGEILKMGKIVDLIQAIGLVPGQRAVRKDLNYGQVWISTDADPDGDDICTLLVNLFFQFWPELFDPSMKPFVKRLVAPNVVAYKGDQRVHFPNRQQYEAVKHKYKNWSIDYYKGLGAMGEKDWNIILYDEQYQISIVDDGNLRTVLSLLFDDKKSDQRKEWLQ